MMPKQIFEAPYDEGERAIQECKSILIKQYRVFIKETETLLTLAEIGANPESLKTDKIYGYTDSDDYSQKVITNFRNLINTYLDTLRSYSRLTASEIKAAPNLLLYLVFLIDLEKGLLCKLIELLRKSNQMDVKQSFQFDLKGTNYSKIFAYSETKNFEFISRLHDLKKLNNTIVGLNSLLAAF